MINHLNGYGFGKCGRVNSPRDCNSIKSHEAAFVITQRNDLLLLPVLYEKRNFIPPQNTERRTKI
jgi:hypothetical protein